VKALWFLLPLGAAAIAVAAHRYFRKRPSAEEIERRRRALIQQTGKLGDGEIVDVDGLLLVYSYAVAGVNYTVSQDATALAALLPEDRMSLVGPVLVKYVPRNPPNSIVICEEWTGLRNLQA
jgi:hypothetical protein